jgi:hypothetical protein
MDDDAEREARSARVVAAAQHAAPALAPLPHALVLHILSLLPVDARLRCAEVCRSWRAALEERSLWLRLDLSASGVNPEREATDAGLVGGGTLAELDICGSRQQLLDVPGALALGNALRASSTITAVSLRSVGLWRDPAAATALLGALTGHASLHSLDISHNRVGRDQAGAVIAALVAANAPALHELNVSVCYLGEEGLRPLFDALPANTHLRTLQLGVTASIAFLRDRLLPAVRANTSLTSLDITVVGEGESEAREAQEIVNSRAAR